jgi:shikimate dehydrogenase
VVTRLEVWGDPIAHSRSPQLHSAAYAALGLDWTYGRRRVGESAFAAELAGLDASFRGLSLTMPLKGAAREASVTLDRAAELTGAVNTLLLTADGAHGFNTDIGGIARDLREHGIDTPAAARLVGAGATATSALVALNEIGTGRVDVVARRPEAAAPLVALGERLGMRVTTTPLGAGAFPGVDVTISTLPGEADVAPDVGDALARGGGLLYDVVYGHWPTALAQAWELRGAPAVWGLGMLLHQALLQVRVFTAGDPAAPLADEERVLAAMRAAVIGD